MATEDEHTTAAVYAKQLPLLTSEWDAADFFARAGELRTNPRTGRPRVKLYREDATGIFTGDGTAEFNDHSSATHAASVLSGADFEGNIVHVELATTSALADAECAARALHRSRNDGPETVSTDEWSCSKCKKTNPAGRGKCKRCGASNAHRQADGSKSEMAAASSGKWNCPGCFSANASKRTTCVLCHHPKPEGQTE